MIEHGIVEASSYTPSRVLSPTLHAVGDFVEVRYHSEKEETSSLLNCQTQATVQSDSVAPAYSKQNGSTPSSWKNVEELLAESRTNSAALTFIPCESGAVENVTDIGEILLRDDRPSSSGDVTVKYGDDSPGVHSTRSKSGIVLSDTVAVPSSSITAEVGTSSTENECKKTPGSEIGHKTEPVVSDKADGVVSSSADAESEADRTSTQTKTASNGTI